MADVAKHITRLGLSGDEITSLTQWDDAMVSDYLAIHESLLLVADAIDIIAAMTDTPATATSTGRAGQIAFDASFFYVCYQDNNWKRVGLVAW